MVCLGRLAGAASEERAERRLTAGDRIAIEVLESPDTSRDSLTIDDAGDIQLPMAGRLAAAGLTLAEIEAGIAERLRVYIHDPHVTARLVERRREQVSVLGAVRQPGLHALPPEATLVEVLSLAGGAAEDAGPRVTITRRADQGELPLRGARNEGDGGFQVARVDLAALLAGEIPGGNITVQPHDVISIPRAEMVYVIGAVERSGGFVLNDSDSVTVLEALALAGGLGTSASAKKARILRASGSDAQREELPVNLAEILKGKSDDVSLERDDILFVPTSGGKAVAARAAQAALSVGTGVAIWRAGR